MSKRSAEELIAHYERKIAKIRRKERNEVTTDDDSVTVTDDNHSLNEFVSVEGTEEDPPEPNNIVEIPFEEIVPDTIVSREAVIPSTPGEDTTPEPKNTTQEIDPDLIAALGDCTDESPEYGNDIHERLAKLWQPLLLKGLTKEAREKLFKEYAIPNNCRLLQAPKMNPEIAAAITDSRKTKDKRWVANQQQIGTSLTAINRSMEILMTSSDKASALKHLSNACRMLCDIHALHTKIRTRVVCAGLDKTTVNVTNNTERDELLFGGNLAEKIKAAKTLERQGNQIKRNSNQTKHLASTSRASYSENWQAPPRYPSRGRGGFRKPTPNPRRQTSIVTPPGPPLPRGPRPAHQMRPRTPQQ